ncbi:RNA methyltransferase [Aquincola sp. MAHUQ-54]|uniref:RNA methyltransferase n=1 Tax=Aquincola agrisoli TaxID=3119538 RepID=A0AAW9QI20_9BURK
MSTPGHITSRDNPLLVKLRKLAQDPAGYRKYGLLWLEGDHLARALRARGGRAQHALVAEGAWAREPSLHDLAQWAERVSLLPDAIFKTLSTLESPAPIGFVVDVPPSQPLLPLAPTVVLDRLQDAGNVGSILRSAAALGVQQVIALKGTAALWSPKVLRAGMGAHFGLRLIEGLEPSGLSALEVPWVATSSHAPSALPDADLPWPCAWVLGHEGRGVDPALMARCAVTVRIPQPGGEESLNVAAAAAVCLYESARRRAVP